MRQCLLRHYALKRYIQSNNLCTNNAPNNGICLTDQGNPLISLKRELVGIASWHLPCGLGFPDVYVRVYSHVPWIKEVLSSS